MRAVAFGLQRAAASIVKLYSLLYGIVSRQLVLPVNTMGTGGTTLTSYVVYTKSC